jgi:tellurite resistance protein TerC
MDFDFAFITIIIQLVFLECVLSIDNAAVLGAMVAPLPNDKPVPWPASIKPLFGWLDPYLGMQRDAALKVGLLGAYAGRVGMLLIASVIIQNVWMQVVGAIYLIYLAVKHFGEQYRHKGHHKEEETDLEKVVSTRGGFWGIVLTIELADLAFSLDNVVAAVTLSDELWVVILGVAIGIIAMRFAASIFTKLIAWEPALEVAAYLLLIAIGGQLLIKVYLHVEIDEWTKFAISLGIIFLVILFARVALLRQLTIIFRPFQMLFALINDLVNGVLGLLTAPFRRQQQA